MEDNLWWKEDMKYGVMKYDIMKYDVMKYDVMKYEVGEGGVGVYPFLDKVPNFSLQIY